MVIVRFAVIVMAVVSCVASGSISLFISVILSTRCVHVFP